MSTAPTPRQRRYESLADAADRIGVSTRTIRRWIAAGELPGYRMGPRLMRVDPHDVDNLLRRIPTAHLGSLRE